MKSIKLIFVFLLLAFMVISHALPVCAEENQRDTISVTGAAEAEADPDMATLTLTMTEQGKSAASTREALSARIDKLNKYLVSLRIYKRDIKTSGYDLAPRFVMEHEKRVQKGYEGTASFYVIVRGISALGSVIDGCAEKCSASVSDVSFGLQKREETERRLLTEAVNDAKSRAAVVAALGGRSLGKLVNANIGTAGGTPVARGEAMNGMAMKMFADSAVPTELSAGAINVRVSVSLVFELK